MIKPGRNKILLNNYIFTQSLYVPILTVNSVALQHYIDASLY